MRPLFVLLTFLLSIFFSILLAEWSIRMLFPVYDPVGMISFHLNEKQVPFGMKNSVTRHWKNTGDFNVSVRINAYGFRDQKDLRASKVNDFFVVGDSFSFGWGVEENERYSNLLETRFGTPVYNISIGSANINGYEKLVRYAIENGAVIKNLIIGICMENDIQDYDNIDALQNYFSKNRSEEIASFKLWLTRHSAIYNLIASLVHQNEVLERIAARTGLLIENYDGMNKNVFNEAALSSSAKKLFELARPYYSFIVIIPSRGLWIGDKRQAENAVHDEFVRRLKALGLKVIDLRPSLEEGGNPLQYHFKNDGHWNKRGHWLAAQVIAEAVLD